MANINLAAVNKQQTFTGTFGNNSVAIFKVTLAAAQVGDVVYFGKLPRGAYVHSVKMVNAALGSSSGTLTVGYSPSEAGSSTSAVNNYWITATNTDSAAVTYAVAAGVPKLLAEEMYVIGVVATAARTGDVYVVVEYLYQNQ